MSDVPLLQMTAKVASLQRQLADAPDWHDRPTGPAGDWLEAQGKHCFVRRMNPIDDEWEIWFDEHPKSRWYGPIPPDPGATE